MSKFDLCVNYIFEAEGGYVDDPHDSGGATKYGVTLKSYRQAFPEATKETIKNLTEDDAKRHYETFYWIPCKAEFMPLPIALMVFDVCVNSGDRMAIKLLQRALKINDDGIWGQQTKSALEKADLKNLMCRYSTQRNLFYMNLCTPLSTDNNERKQIKLIRRKRFLEGWLNRSSKMLMNAQELEE